MSNDIPTEKRRNVARHPLQRIGILCSSVGINALGINLGGWNPLQRSPGIWHVWWAWYSDRYLHHEQSPKFWSCLFVAQSLVTILWSIWLQEKRWRYGLQSIHTCSFKQICRSTDLWMVLNSCVVWKQTLTHPELLKAHAQLPKPAEAPPLPLFFATLAIFCSNGTCISLLALLLAPWVWKEPPTSMK